MELDFLPPNKILFVERGGDLKVYDLLQLTKLEEVFETYKDEKEALVSF